MGQARRRMGRRMQRYIDRESGTPSTTKEAIP